jgi:hypothetical protein
LQDKFNKMDAICDRKRGGIVTIGGFGAMESENGKRKWEGRGRTKGSENCEAWEEMNDGYKSQMHKRIITKVGRSWI